MRPADILFEKVIIHSNVSNDTLIKCSEKRRSLFNNIYFDNDLYDSAKEYHKLFTQIVPELTDATLKYQPLFQWNNVGSSCWLFEQIQLENILMIESWKKALRTNDLKQRRSLFKESIEYSIQALDTLGKYHWEDVSITDMSIMQDRYYLYNMFKAASQYYKTMNEFSIKNNTATNSKCVRMAFDFMDVANHLWISDQYDEEECNNLKAEYLLDQALKTMTDDQCGERCGLLKDIVKLKTTPSHVKAQYNIWKQQNEQVYFQKEETCKTIISVSLTDLFQNLQVIVG